MGSARSTEDRSLPAPSRFSLSRPFPHRMEDSRQTKSDWRKAQRALKKAQGHYIMFGSTRRKIRAAMNDVVQERLAASKANIDQLVTENDELKARRDLRRRVLRFSQQGTAVWGTSRSRTPPLIEILKRRSSSAPHPQLQTKSRRTRLQCSRTLTISDAKSPRSSPRTNSSPANWLRLKKKRSGRFLAALHHVPVD